MVIIDTYKKRRGGSIAATTEHDHDEPESSSEGSPDSPHWEGGSRASIGTPGDKKRKMITKKRVVSMKIGDVDGLRSKGETYPPSDSWAWRKYGQKPIKGSPYPRGYYRCSSSKGCPARKQVERNRLDSGTLMITYAYEHNHPVPTSNRHRASDTRTPTTTTDTITTSPTTFSATTTTSDNDSTRPPSPDDVQIKNVDANLFGDSPQLEFIGDTLVLENLGVEYNWMYGVSSFQTPFIVGPARRGDAEVVAWPLREEDELMFGDLGELPECSIASFSNTL